MKPLSEISKDGTLSTGIIGAIIGAAIGGALNGSLVLGAVLGFPSALALIFMIPFFQDRLGIPEYPGIYAAFITWGIGVIIAMGIFGQAVGAGCVGAFVGGLIGMSIAEQVSGWLLGGKEDKPQESQRSSESDGGMTPDDVRNPMGEPDPPIPERFQSRKRDGRGKFKI